MKTHPRARAVVCALFVALIVPSFAQGQTFVDPGFENYVLSPGGFVQPATGPWLFANDAGVARPPATNSSTGPLNTWSATFAPVDGLQYASTYAGSDTLRQVVVFNNPGDYRLSVYAAAPNGTLTIPGVGTSTLGDGQFTFTLGNLAIGSTHLVTAGNSWSLYTVDFNVPAPGAFQLGIRNTASAPYFINYDAFALQPVPEPSTLALALLGALAAGAWWKRRAG
jgi:hypothetical protein